MVYFSYGQNGREQEVKKAFLHCPTEREGEVRRYEFKEGI